MKMSPFRNKPSVDFPPKPEWKPNIPVDIDRIVKTFAYYTNNKAAFVVFEHGTSIIVNADATDMESEAIEILDKIYNSHPDFDPREMDDENIMVMYSQPDAVSIVFADEYERHSEYIDQNHQAGVLRDEVLFRGDGEPNVFDQFGKAGLFARARMFLDAQSHVVARKWLPNDGDV
jgi:hypothetical protein